MVTYQKNSFHAMGSTINVEAELDEKHSKEIFTMVEECFRNVETIASRFDNNSELTFLNDNLQYTVEVDEILVDLIKNAYHAYSITDGNFDPRILTALSNIGYADTFENNKWGRTKTTPLIIRERWMPTFHENKIHIGSHPIDLGGIGKSYTVWLASNILEKYTRNFYINAGGDITFSGVTQDDKEWTVGVDNPFMEVSDKPLAILTMKDISVATSSIAKRSWILEDGRRMHHIINPKTGLPSNDGIQAVTILNQDIITAEVWSKSLFFETPEDINEITQNLGLPAIWFTSDHKMHFNELVKPYIIWSI